MKKIIILGATGSIGETTLRVVRRYRQQFEVVALAAGENVALLASQVREFKPRVVSVKNEVAAARLREILPNTTTEICYGNEGCVRVATFPEGELVVSAIVGAAGLLPTMAAIEAKKTIALANKETLVIAGRMVIEKAKKHQVQIIPVDSEHSGLFQCLAGAGNKSIRRLILTASGGSCYQLPLTSLTNVTPEQALAHPVWRMGKKISIDSATLMNKGLEVIEAYWLFGTTKNQIEVVVHPQSAIHALVEFIDGTIMAQLAPADMFFPILYALSYPQRWENPLASLELARLKTLSFEKPDTERFPCLTLAYDALDAGDSMMVVLNGANEVAVAAFLNKRIGFMDIPRLIRETMQRHQPQRLTTVAEVLEIDAWSKGEAERLLGGLENRSKV